MDDPAYVQTVLPLLDAGWVDAVEWSFDTQWQPTAATTAILDAFGKQQRLYGHGVLLSLLSGVWTERQEAWMQRLAKEVQTRNYVHISEHIGFMTAGPWIDGAPLPMPLRDDVIAVGVDRLTRLATVGGRPVGLENLAIALGPNDVHHEAEMLQRLLEPVDGFLVLDLHNLWCRAVNYGVNATELLRTYPLGRVRELHISGGSWDGRFRRDTHDGAVPDAVWSLLPQALESCPNVQLVVLEQEPNSLRPAQAQAAYRSDFTTLRQVLHAG
jgi:uncharacterized protein (UPF0276 family)